MMAQDLRKSLIPKVRVLLKGSIFPAVKRYWVVTRCKSVLVHEVQESSM